MKRYVTKSVFIDYNEDGEVSMTADEVFEDDDDPIFSGLYDASGQKLYRESVKQKIGFHMPQKTRG